MWLSFEERHAPAIGKRKPVRIAFSGKKGGKILGGGGAVGRSEGEAEEAGVGCSSTDGALTPGSGPQKARKTARATPTRKAEPSREIRPNKSPILLQLPQRRPSPSATWLRSSPHGP